MAAVTDVDVERRQVVLDRGERVDYDSLIMACGGETVVLRPRRMEPRCSCALKTLDDAADLR